MKKAIKFSGQNIAAAVLVVAFFLPWLSITFTSLSGFSIASSAISPGILGSLFSGFTRLLIIFLFIIPACGAFIVWQNYSPSEKYAGYIGRAHILPLVVVVVEIVALYFKISDTMGGGSGFGGFGIDAPSVFNMLGFGVYLTVAASIYLFLIKKGTIKDKDFSSQQPAAKANDVVVKDEI